MSEYNLKILLFDKNENIIQDDDFLEKIKEKLMENNTYNFLLNLKLEPFTIQWQRLTIGKKSKHFMGDLFSYPIYEIDSIIYKHTEQTIRSFASETKYSIHFHISRILADKVIHPEAAGVII